MTYVPTTLHLTNSFTSQLFSNFYQTRSIMAGTTSNYPLNGCSRQHKLGGLGYRALIRRKWIEPEGGTSTQLSIGNEKSGHSSENQSPKMANAKVPYTILDRHASKNYCGNSLMHTGRGLLFLAPFMDSRLRYIDVVSVVGHRKGTKKGRGQIKFQGMK